MKEPWIVVDPCVQEAEAQGRPRGTPPPDPKLLGPKIERLLKLLYKEKGTGCFI